MTTMIFRQDLDVKCEPSTRVLWGPIVTPLYWPYSLILKVDACGLFYIMKGGHTTRNIHGDILAGRV